MLLLLSFSHLFYSFNKLRSSEACSNALESSARSLQLDENKVNRRHSAHSHAHTHAFTQKRTKSSYINCNFRELCCLVFVRFVQTHFSSQIFFPGKENECVMRVPMLDKHIYSLQSESLPLSKPINYLADFFPTFSSFISLSTLSLVHPVTHFVSFVFLILLQSVDVFQLVG